MCLSMHCSEFSSSSPLALSYCRGVVVFGVAVVELMTQEGRLSWAFL